MVIPGPVGDEAENGRQAANGPGASSRGQVDFSSHVCGNLDFRAPHSSWQAMLKARRNGPSDNEAWPRLSKSLSTILLNQNVDCPGASSEVEERWAPAITVKRMALLVLASDPHASGHCYVRMADPTGEVSGTLHNDCGGLDILSGVTLLVRDVPVLLADPAFGVGTGFCKDDASHPSDPASVGGFHLTILRNNIAEVFRMETTEKTSAEVLDPMDVYDLKAIDKGSGPALEADRGRSFKRKGLHNAVPTRPISGRAGQPAMAERRGESRVATSRGPNPRLVESNNSDCEEPGSPAPNRMGRSDAPKVAVKMTRDVHDTLKGGRPSLGTEDLDAVLDGLDSE